MPETSILSDDFVRELINVGEVDILVGVPTYNDGATVGQVVQAVRAGLLQYFPRERAVIVDRLQRKAINATFSPELHALWTGAF